MGIILFILIFCVVVVAHEFGHFIIAKVNGIHVVEFAVGMGPTLLGFEKNGTKYSLKLLPIGGACMFEGEDGREEAADGQNQDDSSSDKSDHITEKGKYGRSFPEAPLFARIATVVAGPIFNFILAFFLSLFIVGSIGTDLPVVGDVTEGGGAEAAGLMSGDVITKINHHKIHLFREISLEAMLADGSSMNVTYERNGKEYRTVLTPVYSQDAGRYYLGITMTGGYTRLSPPKVIVYSGYEVKYWIDTTIKSLGMLLSGKAGVKDLSGPVGMADAVGDIYTESKSDGAFYVWLNMLNFAILLSANLGVLNLIPFPALDGGRLFIYLIELVRRKPLPAEKEGIINFVGFALLMLLMVVVLYNDIARIVTGR